MKTKSWKINEFNKKVSILKNTMKGGLCIKNHLCLKKAVRDLERGEGGVGG
jgi:hypothetical protein